MEKLRALWPRGLAGKLIKFVVLFVLCLGIAFLLLSRMQVAILRSAVTHEDEKQMDMVQAEYVESMSRFTEDSLMQLIIWAADKTDDEFWILGHDIRSLQQQVEDVFEHPENYGRVPVSPPLKENGGKYVLQIFYPGDPKEADPKSVEMMERLANLAPMMEEFVRGNEGYTLDMLIALPDGLALVMDNLSDKKFDENGNITDYDPTTRPWYQGAVKSGDIFFSSAVKSAFYDFNEVVFGIPVYRDGELVAVLEGSTELGVLQTKLSERNIGNDGFSVLISDEGQLVCTPHTEGEFKMREDLSEDIRETVNPTLKELIDKALAQDTGIMKVQVDGQEYYAAYAPIDTVGWTQISFVSTNEISRSTDELLRKMDESSTDMLTSLSKDIRFSFLLVVVVLLIFMMIAIFMASMLAKKRVRPINRMSIAVKEFVSQDMAFEMEEVYRTGDEIQELAESFETMSERMKDYVQEIVDNAEKQQRLATVMEAASQIQARMLPRRKPDFYNKPGYELFAKMVPAKDVGGDLYDFFYLDDDRLAIMIGDVSGKGITAALFMALCKQMIKSQMLLKNGDVVAAMTESNLRLIEESANSMFVTVWLGVVTLSTGELNFVNGGHMYAAIRRNNSEWVIEEDKHSMLLGAMDFAKYSLNTITLNKGDMLYLYTDGVTEAHDKDSEMFGEERLLSALNEGWFLSVGELDTLVRNRVAEFTKDTEQYDDITTLCFRYLGLE